MNLWDNEPDKIVHAAKLITIVGFFAMWPLFASYALF